MRRILDAEYKKADLNTVMEKKFQHVNTKGRYILLTFLKEIRRSFRLYIGWVEYHYVRLVMKGWYETSIFATLSIIKGTRSNVQK